MLEKWHNISHHTHSSFAMWPNHHLKLRKKLTSEKLQWNNAPKVDPPPQDKSASFHSAVHHHFNPLSYPST